MPSEHPDGQTPQQAGPEQYDFIVNYDKNNQPKRLISVNNSSLKARLLIAGGGGLLLIIFIWVFIALLSNASNSPTAPLIGIAQAQNELARISLEAVQNASTQPPKTFAIPTNLSLLSEQQAMLAYLHGLGSNPDGTVLLATKNTNSDASLKIAKTNGNYDQTYISIAQLELSAYEHTLQQAFANTKNIKEQQLLSTAYTQAQLLMQQSSQTE